MKEPTMEEIAKLVRFGRDEDGKLFVKRVEKAKWVGEAEYVKKVEWVGEAKTVGVAEWVGEAETVVVNHKT